MPSNLLHPHRVNFVLVISMAPMLQTVRKSFFYRASHRRFHARVLEIARTSRGKSADAIAAPDLERYLENHPRLGSAPGPEAALVECPIEPQRSDGRTVPDPKPSADACGSV